jgi:transcriptional regulator with XRE-family HTH domain
MKKPTHRPRRKQLKLARKLFTVREALGLTQSELIDKFGLGKEIKQQHVSAWEKGIREPDLQTLLQYAEVANICVEILMSEKSELPKELPAKKLYHRH